jgi:prepilin signal peptidase PulO-like enzyme (type II secretory pathway)
MQLLLFCFGLIFGSFLNVIAVRYNENEFLLTRKTIGGRSHCPSCKKRLTFFELVPLFSFLFQRGRCRKCGYKLSWQYPISELLSGIVFALVPTQKLFTSLSLFSTPPWVLPILWVIVFEALLLISLIDFRLTIIPDELNVLLVIAGLAISFFSARDFGLATGSFLGPYALMFGFRNSLALNRLFAAVFALVLFGVIILVTRGRGMGLGDLKLALALAVVFGWPEIIAIVISAFVIGSMVGIYLIARREKGIKSYVPFGPFLATASFVVFFWGENIIRWYFSLFRM